MSLTISRTKLTKYFLTFRWVDIQIVVPVTQVSIHKKRKNMTPRRHDYRFVIIFSTLVRFDKLYKYVQMSKASHEENFFTFYLVCVYHLLQSVLGCFRKHSDLFDFEIPDLSIWIWSTGVVFEHWTQVSIIVSGQRRTGPSPLGEGAQAIIIDFKKDWGNCQLI